MAFLSQEKLIVGFNDEIIDIKYLNLIGSHIAVATNSEQVFFFFSLYHIIFRLEFLIF